MPIFRVNNELHCFAHVPKCAGTTIEAHLVNRFGPLGLLGTEKGFNVSLQHLTWAQVTSVVPEIWIDSSFAVVRHPLARFVSAYNMRLSQVHPPFPREISITDFLDWAEVRLHKHPALLDNHLRPQVDFMSQETRVFRLEEGLAAVIADLDRIFGARPDLPPLGHHDFHDPETEKLFDVTDRLPAGVAERVAQIYAVDYARFDYDPASVQVKLKVLKPGLVKPIKRQAWRMRARLTQAVTLRGAKYDA